jgi:hypothetical protein
VSSCERCNFALSSADGAFRLIRPSVEATYIHLNKDLPTRWATALLWAVWHLRSRLHPFSGSSSAERTRSLTRKLAKHWLEARKLAKPSDTWSRPPSPISAFQAMHTGGGGNLHINRAFRVCLYRSSCMHTYIAIEIHDISKLTSPVTSIFSSRGVDEGSRL